MLLAGVRYGQMHTLMLLHPFLLLIGAILMMGYACIFSILVVFKRLMRRLTIWKAGIAVAILIFAIGMCWGLPMVQPFFLLSGISLVLLLPPVALRILRVESAGTPWSSDQICLAIASAVNIVIVVIGLIFYVLSGISLDWRCYACPCTMPSGFS